MAFLSRETSSIAVKPPWLRSFQCHPSATKLYVRLRYDWLAHIRGIDGTEVLNPININSITSFGKPCQGTINDNDAFTGLRDYFDLQAEKRLVR